MRGRKYKHRWCEKIGLPLHYFFPRPCVLHKGKSRNWIALIASRTSSGVFVIRSFRSFRSFFNLRCTGFHCTVALQIQIYCFVPSVVPVNWLPVNLEGTFRILVRGLKFAQFRLKMTFFLHGSCHFVVLLCRIPCRWNVKNGTGYGTAAEDYVYVCVYG